MGSLESQGTCEIFLQFLKKRNLEYTQFLKDGIIGTFDKVRNTFEEAFKGGYVVVAGACIGHVQWVLVSGNKSVIEKIRIYLIGKY